MAGPKIGRNDPCPCGSGKKYKRCCLNKDESMQEMDGSADTRELGQQRLRTTAPIYLVEQLDWQNPAYKEIAFEMANRFSPRYDRETVNTWIVFWYLYAEHVRPFIRKPEVYLAALEYCIGHMDPDTYVTRLKLAKDYGVSVSSISRRVAELLDFVETAVGTEGAQDELFQGPAWTLSPGIAEQELYKLERLLAGKEFSSLEEMNDFVRRLVEEPERWSVDSHSLSKRQQAQELLYKAWKESSAKKQIQLVRKAMKLDPDNPDAYNILAEVAAGSIEEAMDYYRQGIQAGERSLGQDYFEENKGHFWGLIETRPYMRAKYGYAECLIQLGNIQEAMGEFEQLLELNPSDNQGVRYRLLQIYIEERLYRKAAALARRYKEDLAFYHYNNVLIEYGLNGVSKRLLALWKRALTQNPYVMDYLVNPKRIPRTLPEYYSPGTQTEAVIYAAEHVDLWQREPELMKWVKRINPRRLDTCSRY